MWSNHGGARAQEHAAAWAWSGDAAGTVALGHELAFAVMVAALVQGMSMLAMAQECYGARSNGAGTDGAGAAVRQAARHGYGQDGVGCSGVMAWSNCGIMARAHA